MLVCIYCDLFRCVTLWCARMGAVADSLRQNRNICHIWSGEIRKLVQANFRFSPITLQLFKNGTMID